MRQELSDLENELQRLRAAPLDEQLLARLEACGDATITRLDPLEVHLEQQLRACKPAPLPAHLQASLAATLAAAPFPAPDRKIVRFPGKTRSTTPPYRRYAWPAAAAAVAIIGAIAGWQLPHPRQAAELAASPPPPAAAAPSRARTAQPAADTPALTPAAFRRGLSAASDEGVIWQNEQQPHRVLKFVYQERVTLKDSAGRTYQVEQPRVEYLIVPAKTD